MSIGWGLFNLIEGIVDHHIFNLHHVYERLGLSVWDWAFLAFGLALITAGTVIVRAEEKASVAAD